jgi:alkylation response protein AidB-like acyl-CoA dehydrogenase
MRFGFNAEQRALAAAVRDVLAAHCPPKLVRAAADEPTARRGELWRHLADLGLFGLLVPAADDGLGLSEVEAVLVLEELGRAAAPGPILETLLVGPSLLPGRLLPAGEVAVSACLGPGRYAADADVADLVLVASGDALYVVPRAQACLTAQPSADPSRRLYAVDAAAGTRLVAGPGARCDAQDRGALGTAAQLVGVATHLLETTVDYACHRRQFGRAIGQFQVVQHRLADVRVALEFTRPLVYRAASAMQGAEPAASRDVSAAAASAIEAAELAARAALQIHGAVGYTAELDLHLWLRRVWSLRTAWGTAGWHRARVADALL